MSVYNVNNCELQYEYVLLNLICKAVVLEETCKFEGLQNSKPKVMLLKMCNPSTHDVDNSISKS